jgi:hypothetical protein
MATPLQFAEALLDQLGLPRTQNRLVSLVAFVGIEGTFPAGHNPLNTTLSMPGATNRTGVGVKDYVDWAQGVDATARTLKGSNMRGIVDSLSRDDDPQTFLQALSDSPWCSAPSTVDGRYPECGTADAQGMPCYCNYAKFNAQAIYNAWANRDDGSGTIATSPLGFAKQHPLLTVGLALAAMGTALWYFRPDLFAAFVAPVKHFTAPVRRLVAGESPRRRRRRRYAALR